MYPRKTVRAMNAKRYARNDSHTEYPDPSTNPMHTGALWSPQECGADHDRQGSKDCVYNDYRGPRIEGRHRFLSALNYVELEPFLRSQGPTSAMERRQNYFAALINFSISEINLSAASLLAPVQPHRFMVPPYMRIPRSIGPERIPCAAFS